MLSQFQPTVADEILTFISKRVLPDPVALGEIDDFSERSARYEIRTGLLLQCDISPVTPTLEVLSVEALVAPAPLD